MAATKVFISYSRDSEPHATWVRAFADALRWSGVEVSLDTADTLSPARLAWLEEQLRPERNPFILAVCTHTYRMMLESPTARALGLDDFAEAAAIARYLAQPGVAARFIPILIGDEPEASVPLAMQASRVFRIGGFNARDGGFKDLIDRLKQAEALQPSMAEEEQTPPQFGALLDADMARLMELHANIRRAEVAQAQAAERRREAEAAARESSERHQTAANAREAPLPPPPASSRESYANTAPAPRSYAPTSLPPPGRDVRASRNRSRAPPLWIALLLIAAGAGAFAARHQIANASLWLAALLRLGAPPPLPGARSEAREVDVSAFAPACAERGAVFLVQAFAHLPSASPKGVAALAREVDPDALRRGVMTLDIEIAPGDRLDFVLEGEWLAISEPQQSFVWRGRSRGCSFLVNVGPDFAAAKAHLRLRVFRNAAPVGAIGFAVAIEDVAPKPQLQIAGETAGRYRRAFLSYASADRAEVLKRAQGLRAAGLDFFQDLLSLEPGERWERRLFEEIDSCDLFLLFWSRAASDSSWVRREIEYARDRARDTGRPREILPILLEGPPPPAPPEALRDVHFNDPLLYLIAAIDKMEHAHPAS